MILGLNIVIAALCVPAYAQTNTTSDPNQPPPMSQTVRDFDRLLSNPDQLHQSTRNPRPPKSIAPVLLAIPQFRKATADLRQAIGEQKSMRSPVQSLEKVIKPLAEYFKDLKLKPAALDVQELKSYTDKDLVWETLTTAERTDNNLQIAGILLRDSNRSGAVTVKTMQFYGEIDSDLERLKCLLDRVAARRVAK